MGRRVDLDELIDATEVAHILGLSRAGAVSVYQARYSSMPRPVFDRGSNRAKLWLRPEIEEWASHRASAASELDRRSGH